MSMRLSSLAAAWLVLAALPHAASAQGTLSTQGFGYPTGEMGARALGTGGAIAEFDPYSSTNPSALAGVGSTALYVQAEPEFRSLRAGSGTENGTITRHPLAALTVPFRGSWVFGVSVANLLDRSFETTERRMATIGDTALGATNRFKSDGAIGDVRVALAWLPVSWLRLGIAGHAITGDNRLRSTQAFDDSARFAPIVDTTTVTYVGSAVSAGVEAFAGSVLGVAASYRRGGGMSVKHGDTTLASANVPDRLSFSAAYVGIRGTMIAVRSSRDTWTRMRGLGSSTLPVSDTWDTSVGADVLGPRWGDHSLQIRAGGRWRTLPFGLADSEIRETSASFGLGTLLARGRIGLDLAAIRASRSPVSSSVDLHENAWTVSVGVTVRP
jgi:hypothetical protein